MKSPRPLANVGELPALPTEGTVQRAQRTRVVSLVCVIGVVVSAAACPPKRDPTATTPATSAAPAASAAPSVSAAPSASTAPSLMFDAPPAGEQVLVVFTASVQGYVEPCGCTAEPLGGVARLAAAVAQARVAYGGRVLLLDAGDLLFEKPDDNAAADMCQAQARTELLVASYARAGLFATARGPLDDVRGRAFRDALMTKYAIPTLSLTDDAPATSALQLRSRLDAVTNVGVLGVRLDDDSKLKDARRAVSSEIQELLKRGARAVVLLAQSPRVLTRQLVADIAGLDVVIQGRAPGETPVAVERVGGAVIVGAGQQAQHLGAIAFDLTGRTVGQPLAVDDSAQRAQQDVQTLDVRIAELGGQVDASTGARQDFLRARLQAARTQREQLRSLSASSVVGPHLTFRALPLKRGMAQDDTAKRALDAYSKAIPTLVSQCEATLSCAAAPAGSATFVGAQACQTCHAAAYAFWSAQSVTAPGKDASGAATTRVLGHARAWQTLVDGGKHNDRGCVACHSVGFAVPGGACKTTDVVPMGLQNVQCESCHGAGSLHVESPTKASIIGAPTEATCRGCHHVPHIETTASFVFTDKLKLILGVGHGRTP